MPRVGTVSASDAAGKSTPSIAAAMARTRRASREYLLRIMVRVLVGWSIDGSLGLRLEFNDLEAERIPSPRARILRGLRVRILDCGNPVTELVLGAGTGSKCFQIADLR